MQRKLMIARHGLVHPEADIESIRTSKDMFVSGTTHIINGTSAFVCDINPSEVMYLQHAHGDCQMAVNASAYSVPVESAQECTSGKTTAIFEVSGSYENAGETIVLVGSIPELGNWTPTQAIPMTVANPGPGAPTFTARVDVDEGSGFEYKYIMRESDGSETWECCETRVRGGGTAV
jgi:hypothetical protein